MKIVVLGFITSETMIEVEKTTDDGDHKKTTANRPECERIAMAQQNGERRSNSENIT